MRSERIEAHLRSAGFHDARTSADYFRQLPDSADIWMRAAQTSADPDLVALQLVRLHEADPNALRHVLDHGAVRHLAAVMGASRPLGDFIVAHSDAIDAVWVEARDARQVILDALASATATADDLRRAYRNVLISIAATDLTDSDPVGHLPEVAARLTDAADAALEGALLLARRQIDPDHTVKFAIIAMGKTGARELNYISDVDVMYVVGVQEGQSERSVIETATRLAAMTAQACSGAGSEPPLWAVDATLRPEGRDGALVRTVESYVAYYQSWAHTWEFQALLKARPVAGDRQVGQDFIDAITPFVWSAADREGFVDNARTLRQRAEALVPAADSDRELKLGAGGLRDVEFTIQLLQLVHGRTDESIRIADTVGAIRALSDGGYVARTDARDLTHCYCFLRTVEHRAQLARMRRTHMIPSSGHELRRIARAMGPELMSAENLIDTVDDVRERVRKLHDDMFYRPIIAATARLAPDEAALDLEAAKARLAALGYLDPAGALGHIKALTHGTSRRATIQRHLLPVFMTWLGHGADPDLGLLNFRTLSERIGDSHWYLSLLRDSGLAASRLCELLPSSRWVASALAELPEAVQWLDGDEQLKARDRQRLINEVDALISRHSDTEQAMWRVQAVRVREVTRAALGDALAHVAPVRTAIADASDVALHGALTIATRQWSSEHADAQPPRLAFVAMGSYGGRESSLMSDADIIAVHEGDAGAAVDITMRVKKLLSSVHEGSGLSVDMDLRPEGKSGPVSRTVSSYEEYYQRWGSVWERQALLRARPAAGDGELLVDFFAAIDPIRYDQSPSDADIQQIRLLKARMERERLPRGIEPTRHVKLGVGGMSDVEWVVQLMQMRHVHSCEELRTTSTQRALAVLRHSNLISGEDADDLDRAWSLARRIRTGNVLATGRTSGVKIDVLARSGAKLASLAHLLGYGAGGYHALEEDWLRAARRSRDVMERLFWSDSR